MKNILDKDEVLLLEDDSIEYYGTVEEDFIDKIILTNKRIICYLDRDDEFFDIKLDQIKKFNGQPQIDSYDSDEIGDCLRVQTIKGIEYFGLTDLDNISIKDSVKSFFSSKKNENKNIILWVEKIKELCSETVNNNLKNDVCEGKIEEIICSKCGNKVFDGAKFCPSCGNIMSQEKVIEVIKCRKCGAKINEDTKFCPSCGTSIIEEDKKFSKSNENKSSHAGVYKCPVCTNMISSDVLSCPYCGCEVTGREAVLSVQLLGDKISAMHDEKEKINAIKMFVIPNNKEDIIEFLFFAISNFDAKLYATNKNENIAGAWYTKIEQCYQKAITMFVNQYDIDKVKKAYNEVQEKIRNIKKARLIKKISGIGFICLSILLIVLGSPQDSEGNTQVGPLSNIGLVILIVGIILLCSCKKKKAK